MFLTKDKNFIVLLYSVILILTSETLLLRLSPNLFPILCSIPLIFAGQIVSSKIFFSSIFITNIGFLFFYINDVNFFKLHLKNTNEESSLFEDLPIPGDFGHGKFCICKDCREKRLAATGSMK